MSGYSEKNGADALKVIRGIWRVLRPVCVFAASLCIVLGLVSGVLGYLNRNYIRPPMPEPITETDSSFVEVTIKPGSTVKAIGQQLEDAGIVRNGAVFEYTAEFLSKGPKLQAGSFMLSPKMSVMEVIDTLSSMQEAQPVMRFTLIEGSTIDDMAKALVEQKVLTDPSHFLALCKTGGNFADTYAFLKPTVAKTNRRYALEGYLFPDTYEIYVGASEETIISKMLARTTEMLALANAHADESGMSVDEIVTLASMIEKESKRADFYKVAAVFKNRLDQKMRLQSDATVTFITGINHLVLTESELSQVSDYNTYQVEGLPAGPICNPSQFALEAALYPDPSYIEDGILYFCNGDPRYY